MKRLILLLMILLAMSAFGKHQILQNNIKSLNVVSGNNWLGLPVITLGSDEVLNISFDELSHNYHRFAVHIEHCEYDWTVSDGLFESDWLEGFNDWTIDDYENSINTNVLYTHYCTQIPNERCRLKMSGNYRVHVLDEDNDNEEVMVIEFRIVEPLMAVGMSIDTNTDMGLNTRYQQVTMSLNYNSLSVTNPKEQLKWVVMQNGREDNMKTDVSPNYVTPKGLKWEHNRSLIFDAGNEYHRFEVLDPTHITLGLECVFWNEEERRFHVFPTACEPQRNYLFYQDADGAFYIRNSNNYENDRSSDYVYVHYKLAPATAYSDASVFIDGKWTTEDADNYVMTYDERDHSYNATILQKLGYYNYQLLLRNSEGATQILPEEGSFYQTENRYQAFVYYKGINDRTWRIVGYKEVLFKAN